MTWLLITFVVLLICHVPIAFVIGISGAVWFWTSPIFPFEISVQRVVAQTQSIAFLAVPFFIFAGNLMNNAGITSRLLRLSSLLTRRMTGGLAQVSVVLSTLMGGVSGSAVADASMEARILGPGMTARGYPKGYSAAVICFTSLITATIPPSLGLILFGFIGEVSIGRLFAAGLLPGIMMMVILMLTVTITARKHGYDIPPPNVQRASMSEILIDLKDSIWAILFPIILIVGIRFGVFTPTEAGAFAVVYALLIGRFVYKELTWGNFKSSLKDSFIDNGGIILIIAMSGIFGYALTMEQVPQKLSGMLLGITTNPELLLIIIVLFLVVAGLFVDSNVNILLLTPIFLPAVNKVGVDSVHFGIIMMTIVTMGVLTPPVGTALYIVCDIMDCRIEDYTRRSLPFFAAVVLLVMIFIFIPDFILWVPNLVYGT